MGCTDKILLKYMNKKTISDIFLTFFMIFLLIMFLFPVRPLTAATALQISSPYLYNFNNSGTLKETSDISLSSSPYWWVNSGAYLKMNYGHGSTNQGTLESSDVWKNL